MKLQVAGFLDNSSVNGESLRSVVFLSGCHHYCPECHNKEMQNPNYGEEILIEDIILRIKSNMPIISGVTISGGEPFLQWESLLLLLKELHSLPLTCWVYTGYTYEQICNNGDYKKSLPWIDVLVDGLFKKDQLSHELRYIGSTNQRILKLTDGKIQDTLYYT